MEGTGYGEGAGDWRSVRPALRAKWLDIGMVTYLVEDRLLTDLLPEGLELDRWEGSACVSILTLRFRDARPLGTVQIPGLSNFDEWNFRFYVRDPVRGRRGVVFIREYIAPGIVAGAARLLYNEPYRVAPVHIRTTQASAGALSSYEATARVDDRDQSFRLDLEPREYTPATDTIEHFFKEHAWGFGRGHTGKPHEYRVTHPIWPVQRVRATSVDIDWSTMYGEKWAALQDAQPLHSCYARGSAVDIYWRRPLRRA